MIFLSFTGLTESIFFLIIFIGFISIPFLYLNTLQNTIKEINISNRFIQPNEVWFCLIPIIGIFLHLGHVSRLTNSLKKDFNYKKIENDNNSKFGERLGFAFCLMSISNFFFSSYLYYKFNRISRQEYPSCGTCTETENLELNISLFVFGIISLISLICWISYWVKIANCKYLLLAYNNNNPQSFQKGTDSAKFHETSSIYTKKCDSCDTTALAEDKYCMKCGSTSFQSNIDTIRKEIDEKKEILKERLEEKKCPNCNKVIYSKDLSCNSCGVSNQAQKAVDEKAEISKEFIEEDKSAIETFFIKNHITSKDKTYGIIIIVVLIGFLLFNFIPFNNHSNETEAPPEEPVEISTVDTITSTNSNEDDTNIQLVNTDSISNNSSEIEKFSDNEVEAFMTEYYKDICSNDNFDTHKYYSENVTQFITLKNISVSDIDYQINTVAKKQFRDTSVKLTTNVENVKEKYTGEISYFKFSIFLETFRISKNKNTSCDVDIEIGLNSDFKIVSYKELKYYNYKSF